MRQFILFIILWLASPAGRAQPEAALTLDNCQALAQQNYPLVKQRELIQQSRDFSLENASVAYYPQFNIAGQATYQSAVTQVPIKVPGQNIPTISKDQYKVYGELTQTLYDGGLVKTQKESIITNAALEKQKLEVELYKLKDRINQLYFGILIVDEQLVQTGILMRDIKAALDKVNAAINNGVALKSNGDALQAEMLKAGQRQTELKATRKAYITMLGMMINQTLDENAQLLRPAKPETAPAIQRPELLLFYQQSRMLDVQSKMIQVKTLPKVNLFVQGGFGRPALNMLENSFTGYYIGGVRFSWALSNLYTARKERAILGFNYKLIESQKETFLFNTDLALKQQGTESEKLETLIRSDEEIIALRSAIRQTAMTQLENGVINVSDYIRELNAEDQAKQNKILHELQLLMTQYNQQNTTGN